MSAVRDLRPGDRFLTPGGRELTVRKTRAYTLGRYGTVEVLTVEPYIPTEPGETFIADGAYPIQVIGGAA
ncbi:hypothetical protein H9623_13025 [Oerskovia sp. Sa1BUA8]|uniref:Uncharacterized protein n=1 Tax=Oerskovia douganii TaxID=2762210 RepID=A0A9D5UBC1_9CELL|nr:hypothetical protein [Oerskovia douganii]MBE7701219.1 hypothetical protein [Oerskovia douganii]